MAWRLGTMDDLDMDSAQDCIAILAGLSHQVEMTINMFDVFGLQVSYADLFNLWLSPN